MHRLLRGVTAAIVAAVAASSAATAQTVNAGSLKLEFSGRVQTQFNTTSVDDRQIGEPIAWSTFETRRVRLAVEAEYGDWMSGKLQPDFSLGRISLKDAWINWAFSPAFEVRFGQFKKPFSRIESISSTKILPIERGVRIRGLEDAFRPQLDADGNAIFADFGGDLVLGEQYELLDVLGYLGRDLGVAVHGDLGERAGYSVGVFNGNGADARDDNDGKSVAGRLTFEPFASLPLALGAGVSYRETVVGDELELGGTAFELDAEWGDFREPGLHAVLEGATGENLTANESFLAAQGWLAYFRPLDGGKIEGIEPLVRLSWADPNLDRDGDDGMLLTPGLNLYFFGRNRFMVNWDVYLSGLDGVDAEHALRLQAQVYLTGIGGRRDPIVTNP